MGLGVRNWTWSRADGRAVPGGLRGPKSPAKPQSDLAFCCPKQTLRQSRAWQRHGSVRRGCGRQEHPDQIAPCSPGTSWPPVPSVRGRETASPTSVPAAEPEPPSLPCRASTCLAWHWLRQGPWGEWHPTSTRLRPGVPLPRG